MASHDLVIRNGTVIDGTGQPMSAGDVAVTDGVITDVGAVEGVGSREIDAEGRLVAPGFVDIHTHYDGQATWDNQLAPSSWHGVTTVVMGNCGVGFAPVTPDNRERLIQLMEGVEDIPGAALHEGLPWAWESYPEYLDYLDSLPRDIDLGSQVPHGALRLHVMGERGATQEPANPDDIADMAELARQAVEAGALGFTTSRTLNHRTSLGEYTPTLKAERDELVGIAQGLGAARKGVLQVVSDFIDMDHEFEILHAMAAESGRPISISIAQAINRKDDWRIHLDRFAESSANGVQMRGQVGARAVGLLFGLQATLSPFMRSDLYKDLADLPLAERVARMSRPEVRATILEQSTVDRSQPMIGAKLINKYKLMYVLGDPPQYEPDPRDSVAATAERDGIEPAALAYDLLLKNGGRDFLYMPTLNFADGNLDVVREQLLHSAAVPGLSDGGAHVGTICDVSFPSTLLQWWGRDRPHGRIPLETLIAKQSRATAETVGLFDRGILAPGYKADINVIDIENMRLHAPEMHFDLPAGGKRLLQRVDGYSHTFVSGTEIMADGQPTGASPGQLVRGAQTAS
ncbi:MAG: N-acyl-D-amino-acid deacylase family protein [Acidimicrobiales bacterium]